MSWNFYTSGGTNTTAIGLPGGIRYTYSSTTTDADPGAGFLRTDNTNEGQTTKVYISNQDAAGITQTSWYSTFDDSDSSPKGHLYIQSTASAALLLAVTSITSASGYYKLSVSYISGARPADGSTVTIYFTPTGPSGNFANTQTIDAKTANYTLVTADAGKVITMNSSSALTLTVNGSLDLNVGQRIDILQLGTGQVTVSASGATVNATPGLKLRDRYSGASLLCTATDTYVLAGDLTN